ncbi:sodium/proton antiporter, CPA1 family (TC 2.A.36) [Clostridium acidisoli DSM 12555]|uniref:Sodium/proton antiporter, CPA1 family (TC 2.A.36) n=1 Tax=Clostridium acidisoli DSM 12555 TaxID=1121291 RepID=A0A1W1XNX7_9CLOT|nr:Na+/H+ antiporter [Clostridium acidisoli]SMC25577.1 sodium/proton antiporter, CPA1 family (TC 2.A.36) [Clostridium acidisoli DSM 12555]
MGIFITVLILLMCIGVSNVINRFIPLVPVPLIQIAIGIILAISPFGIHMPLDPELFMILFIAPLLYNDGKRIPRDELWNLRMPILLLALGLVFTTVVVVGFVINIMIPSISLSAAFALAAILSPTDAVAVNSMSEKIHLPKKITRLLEGEALMNDASGLVAFKFAVAATVSGVFSITQATVSFFIISIGGILSGVIISFLIVKITKAIRRLGMEDATFHVLVQILTPFVIYMISEELGVSGILAVVAGGIVHSMQSDFTETALSKLKVVSSSTWSVILFILNGLVFLILGLQIPDVEGVIINDVSISNVKVFTYILVISVTLIVLRFIWVYLFWSDKWSIHKRNGEYKKRKQRLMSSVLIALSGVRGTVTLAGAFSIPYVLDNGRSFPERDLIIFISAGVILFTLILASIMLPVLSKENKSSEENNEFEQDIFRRIMKIGIKALNDEMNDKNKKVALALMSNYKKVIKDNFANRNEFKLSMQDRKIEKDILFIGLMEEHNELNRLFELGEISSCVVNKEEHILNNMERYLAKKLRFKIVNRIILLRNIIANMFFKSEQEVAGLEEIKQTKILTSKAAIRKIKSQINEENMKASFAVIEHYNEIIRKMYRVNKNDKDDNYNKQKRELQFRALQAQRNEVQELFENNEITRETANKIRKFINYLEAIGIEEEII